MAEKRAAIVTGGTRGIGFGITAKLINDGYSVLAVGKSKPNDEFCELLNRENGLKYIQSDISLEEDRNKIISSAIDWFGRIDVLVNNAGVAPQTRMDILETTPQSMDYVLDVNLKGTFFLTQLAAKEMIQRAENYTRFPQIINISSISAYTSSTNRGEYCIAKAGVSMVTTLFADRLAEYGIGVYEIRPGIIYTDMTAAVTEKYDKMINEENLLPIKRWGKPEDIANVVSALCSGAFAYSTGEIINVDGGFHIRRL